MIVVSASSWRVCWLLWTRVRSRWGTRDIRPSFILTQHHVSRFVQAGEILPLNGPWNEYIWPEGGKKGGEWTEWLKSSIRCKAGERKRCRAERGLFYQPTWSLFLFTWVNGRFLWRGFLYVRVCVIALLHQAPAWTSGRTMALIQGGFLSAAQKTHSRRDNGAKSVTKMRNHVIDSILVCLLYLSDGHVVWSAVVTWNEWLKYQNFFPCAGWSFSEAEPQYAIWRYFIISSRIPVMPDLHT